MRHCICVLLMVVVLSGCKTTSKAYDLAATDIRTPNSIETADGDKGVWELASKRGNRLFSPGSNIPVVIYVHGRAPTSLPIIQSILLHEGFVVVEPYYESRGMGTYSDLTYYQARLSDRIEQVLKTVDMVRSWDWVDQNRVFYVGYSEGAQMALLRPWQQFNAVMALSNSCKNWPPATSVPLFLSFDELDYELFNKTVTCRPFYKGVDTFTEIIIRGSTAHGTWKHPVVAKAMRSFLKNPNVKIDAPAIVDPIRLGD